VENNIESLKAIILFLALANNYRPELRKMLNEWAKNDENFDNPDLNAFSLKEQEILKSVRFIQNWNYIPKVLRYSFYFEG
jgi:hypothetical protein